MNPKKNTSKILLSILIILIIIAGFVIKEKGFSLQNKEAKKEEVKSLTESTTVATQPESLTSQVKKTEDIETQLFGKYYEKADVLLKDMTLEEKVGQMFLAKYPEKDTIEEIQSLNPGGYILSEKDLKNVTKQSILEKLTKAQESSKIKLILAVNEEGGNVVTVSSNKSLRETKFNSAQELWKKGQIGAILKDSTEKSTLLKSIGLNMNLVPVADVPSQNTDYMYERAYGRGAEKTSEYVSELIKTMNNDKMISTLKHFPGYGNNGYAEKEPNIDKRPYSTFENIDFLPFKSGIEAGVPTILVSHNIVECMDKENIASLSENVHKILRENLNFSGIIMTDDLAMNLVKEYMKNEEVAVKAVQAGNDIIVSSDFTTQKEQVIKAVKENRIDESIINTAVKRILAWKYAYEIIK